MEGECVVICGYWFASILNVFHFSYGSIVNAAEAFEPDVIIVLDHERLFNQLVQELPSFVKVGVSGGESMGRVYSHHFRSFICQSREEWNLGRGMCVPLRDKLPFTGTSTAPNHVHTSPTRSRSHMESLPKSKNSYLPKWE